jgi:hypothetical protein
VHFVTQIQDAMHSVEKGSDEVVRCESYLNIYVGVYIHIYVGVYICVRTYVYDAIRNIEKGPDEYD